MTDTLKEFSILTNPEVINELKLIAKEEDKTLQSLIDEAFKDLIEKRSNKKPRKHVIEHFNESMNSFDPVYKNLAE